MHYYNICITNNIHVMATQPKTRSVSLKVETIELLKTVKSCFLLGRKKEISYDELIGLLIQKGLSVIDPKVAKLFELSMISDDEESDEGNSETDNN